MWLKLGFTLLASASTKKKNIGFCKLCILELLLGFEEGLCSIGA